MRIVVAGIGYVGLSNAILLAQNHDVTAYDIDSIKVGLVNSHQSPIIDDKISEYLNSKKLCLQIGRAHV